MNNDFLLRIKDVTLCLSAAYNHDMLLGRLEIQKITYLIDSMSAYLFILSAKKSHQTYFYGPYDKNIQNAIDALNIRGLVEAYDSKVANNSISCNYALTENGHSWAGIIKKNSKSIQHRSEIADGVLYSLFKRNLLTKVKDLVYAEPMFVDAKSHGYYYDLNFRLDNSGHSYLALVESYLKSDNHQIDIRFATDLYIDYLHTRCEKLSGNLEIGGDFDAVNI